MPDVTVSFTDAQWALITEHHPYEDEVPITVESLKALQERDIKAKIVQVMRYKAASAVDNAFDANDFALSKNTLPPTIGKGIP